MGGSDAPRKIPYIASSLGRKSALAVKRQVSRSVFTNTDDIPNRYLMSLSSVVTLHFNLALRSARARAPYTCFVVFSFSPWSKSDQESERTEFTLYPRQYIAKLICNLLSAGDSHCPSAENSCDRRKARVRNDRASLGVPLRCRIV